MVSNTQMIGQSIAAAEPSARNQEAEAQAIPGEVPAQASHEARPALDPTRYGDWEKNGRCIDF